MAGEEGANKDRGVWMHAVRILAATALVMLLVNLWAGRHAEQTAIPRYCENPGETLHHLERLLVEEQPAGEESRRPYIIAAKLIFLVPRQAEEDVPAYLARLRAHLAEVCSRTG